MELPHMAFFRSVHVSRDIPLGNRYDLTGLGPRRFAHVTLEKVLQGGLRISAKYVPAATLFNKRC